MENELITNYVISEASKAKQNVAKTVNFSSKYFLVWKNEPFTNHVISEAWKAKKWGNTTKLPKTIKQE